jgi:hypothetical protein
VMDSTPPIVGLALLVIHLPCHASPVHQQSNWSHADARPT